MIVCSIHDPAIFDAQLFAENEHYEGRMDEHLESVRQSHLIVCDVGGSVLLKESFAAVAQSPSLFEKLNICLLKSQRIIYLPCEPGRRTKLLHRLDRPGSSTAAGLICHDKVDVLIAAKDTYEAMEIAEMNMQRVCMLSKYHHTPAYMRERLSLGGRALSQLTRSGFIDEIIKPVVYWAERVYLVDKMITKAAYGDQGNGRAQGNWGKFRQTIKTIYDYWNSCPYAAHGCFEIVSVHTGYKVGDELAELLADDLELKHPNVKISLKSEPDVRPIMHDRYLITNHEFQIGFTHGFDVLSEDEPCGVSDAYLRQPQTEKDAVTKLIYSRNCGQWSGRS